MNTPDFPLTNPFGSMDLGPPSDAKNGEILVTREPYHKTVFLEPEIALGNVCEEIVNLMLGWSLLRFSYFSRKQLDLFL